MRQSGSLELSFSFLGTLVEGSKRAMARPSGAWSFDMDAPPPCAGLTESPYDNMFETCACYDHSLQEHIESENGGPQYVWHSPQAFAAYSDDLTPYKYTLVRSQRANGLNATVLLSVYRSFVNEPPALHIIEPASGILRVLEDHPSYFS